MFEIVVIIVLQLYAGTLLSRRRQCYNTSKVIPPAE